MSSFLLFLRVITFKATNEIIPIVFTYHTFKKVNEIIPIVFVVPFIMSQYIGQCFIFLVDKCYSCRCFFPVSYIQVILTYWVLPSHVLHTVPTL
jgi:hypothetical protein